MKDRLDITNKTLNDVSIKLDKMILLLSTLLEKL